MTCEEAGPFLPELSDGSLGDAERRAVQDHLDGCAKCRAIRGRLSRVAGLLAPAARVPDPGEPFWQAQRSRLLALGAGTPAAPRPAFRRPLGRLVMAAAAALLVAAGLGLWSRGFFRAVPAAPGSPGAPSTAGLRPVPRVTSPAPAPAALPKVEPATPPAAPAAPAALPSADAVAATARDSALRLTEEAVEIGLAETPSDRVRALYRAAGSRLGELRQAMRQDPGQASELASAYVMLLSEGVRGVLVDQAESPAALADAKTLAAREARSQETLLAELGSSASGKLKETLDEALATSRALARP